MSEPPDRADLQRLVDEVPHWHHTMTFPHGIRSPGAYDPTELFERLHLGDLHGKRVLDVGARDGFFAFECEKLGAEVVAIDNCRSTGFGAAKAIFGSSVDHVIANVYDLDPGDCGRFDVVLFLGVLYHLRHPLLALDRLRAVCHDTIFVESLVCDSSLFVDFEEARHLREVAPGLVDIPLAQFLPHGRFHRDWTNKWSPNIACLQALLKDAQFEPLEVQSWGSRALVRATVTEEPAHRVRVEQDRGVV